MGCSAHAILARHQGDREARAILTGNQNNPRVYSNGCGAKTSASKANPVSGAAHAGRCAKIAHVKLTGIFISRLIPHYPPWFSGLPSRA